MLTNNSVHFAKTNFNNSSPTDEEGGEFCISNISPLERQKRLRFGVSQFIITFVILGMLLALGADRLWRLPLLFMFWAAAVGYFQAHDKTRLTLAWRGSRKTGDSEEKIEDEAERSQVRRQARRAMVRAFLVALPLTLIAFILPQ